MNALNAHMVKEAVAVLDCAGQRRLARPSPPMDANTYRILNRPGRPALDRGRVWRQGSRWTPRPCTRRRNAW